MGHMGRLSTLQPFISYALTARARGVGPGARPLGLISTPALSPPAGPTAIGVVQKPSMGSEATKMMTQRIHLLSL